MIPPHLDSLAGLYARGRRRPMVKPMQTRLALSLVE
jgi:hypothetical protein